MPATTIDTITYHARPLSYVREWELCKQFFEAFPEYDFPKRYDPYKRYRRIKDLPEFKAYKKKQLTHEFFDDLNYKKIGPSGTNFFTLLYPRDFLQRLQPEHHRQLEPR